MSSRDIAEILGRVAADHGLTVSELRGLLQTRDPMAGHVRTLPLELIEGYDA